MLWIKQTQHEDFRDELVYLKGSEVLPKKKRLNNLSPYFDSETGLIRVGGRIHKTSLPEETKYPVILPHQNRFIALLIQEAHEKQLHAVTNQYPHGYKTRVLDHSRKKCSEESSESVSYPLLFQDPIYSIKDSTSPRGAMTPSPVLTQQY